MNKVNNYANSLTVILIRKNGRNKYFKRLNLSQKHDKTTFYQQGPFGEEVSQLRQLNTSTYMLQNFLPTV